MFVISITNRAISVTRRRSVPKHSSCNQLYHLGKTPAVVCWSRQLDRIYFMLTQHENGQHNCILVILVDMKSTSSIMQGDVAGEERSRGCSRTHLRLHILLVIMIRSCRIYWCRDKLFEEPQLMQLRHQLQRRTESKSVVVISWVVFTVVCFRNLESTVSFTR